MADPEVDLGSLIPGTGDTSAGGGWQEFVAKNKPTGLLQAMGAFLSTPFAQGAAHQLAGGYAPGGVLSQIGPAAAAGMEAQANSEQANHERAFKERGFEAGQAESAANRASHEKMADQANQFKLQIAQEKIQGMLERSRLIRQPTSNQELKIVSDAMNKFMADPDNSKLLSGMRQDQKNEAARAYALGVLETARGATGVRSQGAPLPSEPEGAPAAKPAASGAFTPPKETVPGAKEAPNPDLQKLISGKMGAQVQEDLKTPEGRQKLININPGLKKQIQLYEMAIGATGGKVKP